MSRGPEITVMVVAHNRRDFVAEALGSVVAQDLDPDLFEVVFCTNVPRESLGSEVLRGRVARLDLPEGSWGEWIRAALPQCHGDILCFLDDDDLFEPGKLSSVRSAFRQYPSIGYYHNRIRRFTHGSLRSDVRFGGPRPGPEGPDCGLVEDRRKSRALINRLFWKAAGFNASAIAVRRDLLESLGSLFPQLEVGHPLALFYAGAISHRDLYFDPAALTRYRIHSTNSSVPSGSDVGREWRGALENGGAVIRDSERIARFIASDPRGRFSASPVRSVGLRTQLLRSLSRPDLSRTQLLRALGEYLSLTPENIVADQPGMLAMVALGLLSPRAPDGWLRARTNRTR